uniref:Gonadotropin-inhibitory hormone/neuropeptide VF prepropeptide n=1 Tax=Thalassoma bifasciatum TaxID=76338 RepID=A0A336UJ87_THABI|nr:gonadotropin-inhibitory hormone/neuropeptide VF prepropeptide [Thalassoma bifasciatum]
MSITVFLPVLLLLGALLGTVTTNQQVLEKSVPGGKSLLSSGDGSPTMRKHLHQQTKSEWRRSLDFNSFNIHSTPTSKIRLPSIIKLYPPTVQPAYLHPNMPLRFGRQSGSSDINGPNSTPNMPQRFGRGWEMVQRCAECSRVQERGHGVLPQRFGRSSLNWRLLKTLIGDRLMIRPHEQDFTASSEEMEMQE